MSVQLLMAQFVNATAMHYFQLLTRRFKYMRIGGRPWRVKCPVAPAATPQVEDKAFAQDSKQGGNQVMQIRPESAAKGGASTVRLFSRPLNTILEHHDLSSAQFLDDFEPI